MFSPQHARHPQTFGERRCVAVDSRMARVLAGGGVRISPAPPCTPCWPSLRLAARMAACVASRPATPTMAETRNPLQARWSRPLCLQCHTPHGCGDTRLAQAGGEIGANSSVASETTRAASEQPGQRLRPRCGQRPGQQREALRKLLDDGERTLPIEPVERGWRVASKDLQCSGISRWSRY